MGVKRLVGKTKGGGGASTTVCQLAVMRALAGKKLVVFDLDRQRSTHGFIKLRNSKDIEPRIKVISAYFDLKPGEDPVPVGMELIKEIREAATEHDEVLIDCGGTDNPALRSAMLVADEMYVPLSPSLFDIWALADLNKILSEIGTSRGSVLRPTVFPNAVSPQTNELEPYRRLKDAYKGFNFAGINDGLVLKLRAAYRRSLADGRGVFDMQRQDPKARQELLGLYRMVFNEDWSRSNVE